MQPKIFLGYLAGGLSLILFFAVALVVNQNAEAETGAALSAASAAAVRTSTGVVRITPWLVRPDRRSTPAPTAP